MALSPSLYFNMRYLSETSYEKIDILDSCYEILQEGASDKMVVDIATSYTSSMVLEILEHIKEMLYHVCTTILSTLNNFIINNAKLAKKYESMILSRFQKLNHTFTYETFEYPELRNKSYPTVIPAADFEKQIDKLNVNIIENEYSADETSFEIDNILLDFSMATIGSPVDPSDIKKTTRSIVQSKVQGRRVVKKLTESTIVQFIDDMVKFKSVKDDIMRTRTSIVSEYEILKKTYLRSLKRAEAKSLGIRSMKYPNMMKVQSSEYMRYADINLAMSRLFNSIIQIYEVAFSTKLNIMKERIDRNRDILTKMMVDVGVFAEINARNTRSTKKNQNHI